MTENKKSVEQYSDSDKYLVDMRNRVTRYFCVLYFILSAAAVPFAYISKDSTTFVINLIALFLYTIPFLLVHFTAQYRLAAKIIICVAMVVVVANAVVTNFDISPTTIVWYFVYLVFAHLVLDMAWTLFVAGTGVVSVTVFAVIHIKALSSFDPHLTEHSIIVGSPIAVFVSFAALLYLLSIYKKIRDVMIRNVLLSNRETSRLVGVLSHDMRNHIGAIKCILELIEMEIKEGDDKKTLECVIENLALVDDSSSKALSLVEEIVSASRDLVDTKLYFERVAIADFIFPIVNHYQVIARSKGITVLNDDNSHNVEVMIDRGKFSRAIENLFSNAVKFSRNADTITIATMQEKKQCVISIIDTGIGIPKELHDTIFEPFTNARRVGTANEKTIGLGMSIVKKIVEQHRGSIQLESEVNKGTIVTIHIPIA